MQTHLTRTVAVAAMLLAFSGGARAADFMVVGGGTTADSGMTLDGGYSLTFFSGYGWMPLFPSDAPATTSTDRFMSLGGSTTVTGSEQLTGGDRALRSIFSLGSDVQPGPDPRAQESGGSGTRVTLMGFSDLSGTSAEDGYQNRGGSIVLSRDTASGLTLFGGPVLARTSSTGTLDFNTDSYGLLVGAKTSLRPGLRMGVVVGALQNDANRTVADSAAASGYDSAGASYTSYLAGVTAELPGVLPANGSLSVGTGVSKLGAHSYSYASSDYQVSAETSYFAQARMTFNPKDFASGAVRYGASAEVSANNTDIVLDGTSLSGDVSNGTKASAFVGYRSGGLDAELSVESSGAARLSAGFRF